VSDSAFEYGGVSAEHLATWEDILKDVGFARDAGPARGQPGHEDHQRRATQAMELLWTHLALLPRLLDETHPHVGAYLQSIRRVIGREEPPPPRKRWMDPALDLSHVMSTLEALLLGLIGPQGQSPFPPCSAEIPTHPPFDAWLAIRAGSADLLPGPAARRVVSWRTPRAVVSPEDARKILDGAADRGRDAGEQRRFEEVYAQLTADLKRFADRGDFYIGWTTRYAPE
jgi:hypothetical protein